MITKEQILEAMVTEAKFEIWVGDEFWTGKDLADEAPDAKVFMSFDKAEKEAKKVKAKFKGKKIQIASNPGTNNVELTDV